MSDHPQVFASLSYETKKSQVERIVIWRLDRLGRTAKGLCQLFDDLRSHKVDLVSLRDGFSLDSPAGRLHARILASVAEYETEVRAERVKAGQAVAKANGKRWGGSKPGLLSTEEPETWGRLLASEPVEVDFCSTPSGVFPEGAAPGAQPSLHWPQRPLLPHGSLPVHWVMSQ